MSVYSYLDLSTCHITETEAEALDATSGDSLLCGARVIPHTYGAWVHVPSGDASDGRDDDEERAGAYPNLHACILRARTLGARWINFDADGDVHEDLPTFQW